MGREGVLSSNLKAQQTPDLRAGHKSPLGFKIEERGSDRDWYFVRGRLCVCTVCLNACIELHFVCICRAALISP